MATKSIRLSNGTDTFLPESAQSGSGYCKMADGTLIQWGTETKTISARTTIDYPTVFAVPFIANPMVLTDCVSYSPDVLLTSPNGIGKTGFTGRVYNSYSQSVNGNFQWLAIGRWK